jgi:hypothetical protein
LDIDGWLRRIGLEQYAQTFRDNAIDTDVLRDLTDEHLRWGTAQAVEGRCCATASFWAALMCARIQSSYAIAAKRFFERASRPPFARQSLRS